MVVERDLLGQIKPFLKRKEYIAIIGPRQAGKTTFLEILKAHLIKEEKVNKKLINIVTFEDRRLLREFEDDPVSFVRSYLCAGAKETVYLMLDEFQYAKKGCQRLKLVYDTVKNLKLIVTSSSSLEIKAQVGKYMVGHILKFHLHPFNFGELLQVKDSRMERVYQENRKVIARWLFEHKKFTHKRGEDIFYNEMINYYEEYCIWGGYPAVVLSMSDAERHKVLGDIYNNYMLKDIKGLLELTTENNLYLLSQYLATQIGNIVVYQNMGQAAGLDYRQLKKHLNILKETFIFKEITPYFANRQKELVKNPKIYFMDIGFRNYLIENMIGFDKRSNVGSVVENMLFIRTTAMCEGPNRINFWRTKAGAEVDFVLRINGELIPIEVKFSKYDEIKVSRSFNSFLNSFKPRRGLVLTKNYWGKLKKHNTEILFAPLYYL